MSSEIVVHANQVEMIPVDALKGYDKNSKSHPASQVDAIAAMVREFGWTTPLLIDDDDVIVAGHGRTEVARKLGMTEVPCVRVSGLTEDQRKALRIADNKSPELGGWLDDILKIEMGSLNDAGFDLSLTGFSSLELSSLFAAPEARTDPDDVPDAPADPVSQVGDIWLLGEEGHRVMCGDSLDLEQVRLLLDGVTPELANCDPPYGINAVKGVAAGRGKVRQGHSIPYGGFKDGDRAKGPAKRGHEHGPAKNAFIAPGIYDEIIGDDTTDTAVRAYHLLVTLGVPAVVLWGGNYYANHLPPSRCWLAWDKETNGSFADAELAWTNQDKVVKLFRHQWSGLMKASERGQRRVHPTQKPVALAEWVADTVAPKARTVLDLFLGSGSVLIGAQMRGLRCFGMELSPSYADVCVARWEAFTGKTGTLAETGETFEQVKARRLEVV